MKLICMQCEKVAEASSVASADDLEAWDGLPSGWLTRQKFFCGELESDTTVCSETCARAFDAAERAKQDADRAEYARREEAGELTTMERWSDQLRADMLERLEQDLRFYSTQPLSMHPERMPEQDGVHTYRPWKDGEE
jgi:hypothetical protein